MPTYQSNTPWENCVANQSFIPKRIYSPTTLQDVVDIVSEAISNREKVKAVGAGHSFGDITATTGYLIKSHAFGKFLGVPPNLKPEHFDTKLVNTEAGITIANLIKELAAIGLALPNLGSYTGQAIIGAISTSTHGSGIELEGLPGMVRSMTIISGKGEVIQIEPNDGITDPASFKTMYGLKRRLVQDDKWFYSALVSMGCFGVIYSIVVECDPHYSMKEERVITTWEEAKQWITDPAKHRKNGLELRIDALVNPYPRADGSHKTLVTRRAKTKSNPPAKERPSVWSKILNSVPPFTQRIATTVLTRDPENTPDTLNEALDALVGRHSGPYDRVLSLGLDGVNGYAVEGAIPIARLDDAVTGLFAIAQYYRDLSQDPRYKYKYPFYITSPFSIRFVKPSKAYLSPQQASDAPATCMIEFPFVKFPELGIPQASLDMMHRFVNLCFDLGGRCHWGLEFGNLTPQQIRKAYPKLDAWLEIREELDPDGIFENTFSKRVLTEPVIV
jgi:L-gulono-1,4-lactone dehydrogenase